MALLAWCTWYTIRSTQATDNLTGEKVAIKKVFQDKRYKNREHLIIQDLNHPCVIKLKEAYFTKGDKVKI